MTLVYRKQPLKILSCTFDFFGITATLSIVKTCDDISGIFMTNVLLEGKLLDTTFTSKILQWGINILTLAINFLLSTISQILKHLPVYLKKSKFFYRYKVIQIQIIFIILEG